MCWIVLCLGSSLVEPNNIDELSEAIAALLRNPERRSAMGSQGRKLVEKRFAGEIVVQQAMSLYRDLNDWHSNN